jgi:hypothetical protein
MAVVFGVGVTLVSAGEGRGRVTGRERAGAAPRAGGRAAGGAGSASYRLVDDNQIGALSSC